MTYIVVDELLTSQEIIQEFVVNTGMRVRGLSFRPYLYVHNNPSGTFTFSLKYEGNEIGAKTFTSSDLYTAMDATESYIRLFYKVTFDDIINLNKGTYELVLSASGYTFSELSYIGWIREHEDVKTLNDGNAENYLSNPLTFEAWEYA